MPLWTRRRLLQTGAAASMARWLPRWKSAAFAPGREHLLLDFNWRFHFGNADDPARDFGFGHGGNQASEFGKSGELFDLPRNFTDADWTPINVPHDWAVDLPFVQADELDDFGFHPLGRNFPETSIGWYRRSFTLPADDAGRRITLDFDGIFRDALIALNGHLVGRNFSGYAPFHADVSDIVTYGGRNTLMIRVDATEHEGWFYEGAGIYRHVWLGKSHPVHVAHDGTFVTTRHTAASAVVTVATEVDNEQDTATTCHLVQRFRDADGKVLAVARSTPLRIAPWDRVTALQHVDLSHPALWSIETPQLHDIVTSVEVNGVEVDRDVTPFGIRSMRFGADRGFFLNDRHVLLKGTCNHQDHAGVGVALPDRLQSYRVERLKAMGSNAYRTSHNPPTPELLDACDRLGMLVLDENRTFSSEAEGRSQLERLVRRDRNHPCVFAWSLANEEGADQGNDRGERMAATLRRLVRSLDPTRPVTAAMNGGWGRGFSKVVDVQGFNYSINRIDNFRQAHPTLPEMGTEVASTVSTRGIYANDAARGYLSAYDLNKPGWGATAEEWWTFFSARPYLAGGFVWTGFDYRGEPTPYRWPCISSHFGIMDTCGFPKDNFWYYKAWWGDEPVLHLFPHWNWAGKEGQPIDVWVHSNLERVELFLNDVSLGSKTVVPRTHLAWSVPFTPGKIEARGYRGDTIVLTTSRETTGPAAAIVLHADRPSIAGDGEDVAVIDASVVDAAGRVVPTAGDAITFSVTGNGRLIGVGNGDPSSHEPDHAGVRSAFNGLCCAIIQATKDAGSIQVDASGGSLAGGSITVGVMAARARPTAD
ncbi:MAG: beta-galactosidase GalA [Gemmatimonadales bacterium]